MTEVNESESCADCEIEDVSWTKVEPRCDLCGRWDGKLIQGICPTCEDKYNKSPSERK